jgi:hypothetical protein
VRFHLPKVRTPVPARRGPGSAVLAHLLAERQRIALEVVNSGRKPEEDPRIRALDEEIAEHAAVV